MASWNWLLEYFVALLTDESTKDEMVALPSKLTLPSVKRYLEAMGRRGGNSARCRHKPEDASEAHNLGASYARCNS